MSSEYIIETFGLSKSFGKKKVLNNLNLKVKKGIIYGYLGKNGTGKTTTIKILLGMLSPNSGTARLFGFDADADYVKIRGKIGYVSEDRSLYKWMKVSDALKFVKGFYPGWSDSLASQYLKKYKLDASGKVKDLSRGMLSKLFLAMALSHTPELLILDEPTAALDPIARAEFLEGIIELAEKEEKTIFISTNNLNDVERIADEIGVLDEGNLKLSTEIDDLKQKFRKIKLSFDEIPLKIDVTGILKKQIFGNELILIVHDYNENVKNQLYKLNPKDVLFLDMNLEEIFIEYFKEESVC